MIARRALARWTAGSGVVKTLHAGVAVGVALVVGVASGAAIVSTPRIRAPHECTVALNTASKIFVVQENTAVALHLRATRGQSEFAQHDAEVERLWAEMDELAPVYLDAKADCLGHR